MNEQTKTPDTPKGFSKWMGIAVGSVLILMALVVLLAILNRNSGLEQSVPQDSSSQLQPSADDDALRKSLGK